ncbi:MAG TPA: nuclear transport factor 2 family protein [Herpetosiphonaceae bacterium]|nr:nuclear transport factor 2 family protein [Herpetosiphonaceae bacterium]
MNSEHPHIALLRAYEEASNRHDIESCVRMFAPDGSIETGETYAGVDAIRAAHEYDLGSQTLVAFRDCLADGDTVACTFWNEHELSRAIGDGGVSGKAIFTFRDGLIEKFQILPPDEAERKRFMERARPALTWLRDTHPDALARWHGFDRAAGEAVFALAELWRAHLREQ